VGASTHWDTRADYSQIGGKIDFLAPGGGGGGATIVTSDRTGTNGDNTAASPAGDYQSAVGTSLANPIAAGVGALMLTVAPNLTATQVRDILRTTADKVGPVPHTKRLESLLWRRSRECVERGRAGLGVELPRRAAPGHEPRRSGLGTLRDAIERVNASGCPGPFRSP
jgi:hypothetical protein